MGRLSFSDVKGVIEYNKTNKKKGYEFPMTPKLNTIIGNLMDSQIHIVAGMPSTGTTSFMDQQYVMGPLLQWYSTPPEERQGLKILYFSMTANELKKAQLFLCEYLKLNNNLRVDVPTLNSQKGRLYDISKDSVLQQAIEDSSPFFDEVIDDGVLEIHDGQKNPTDIYNTVIAHMMSIGYINDDKQYVRDEGHEDDLVLVVIDSLDYLVQDSDGSGTVSGPALHEKMKRYMLELKNKYGVTMVATISASVGLVRRPSDTEPHFRQLGAYGAIADRGIMVYNPIIENNRKFFDDAEIYTSAKGNILMRTWHVVRNTDGIESVYDRMFFLPGTGYFVEYKFVDELYSIDDVIEVLNAETPFYSVD